MLLLVALAWFLYAYQLGREREADEAAADAAIAQQELLDQWRHAMAIGNELAADLAAARGKTRIVYRTLREEASHVTRSPVSSCRLGPAFVRVWNDALEGRVSAAAGGAADLAADADPAGAAAAGSEAESAASVDPGRALANQVDNAELCHDVRAQLGRLIQWHHRTGAAHAPALGGGNG